MKPKLQPLEKGLLIKLGTFLEVNKARYAKSSLYRILLFVYSITKRGEAAILEQTVKVHFESMDEFQRDADILTAKLINPRLTTGNAPRRAQ